MKTIKEINLDKYIGKLINLDDENLKKYDYFIFTKSDYFNYKDNIFYSKNSDKISITFKSIIFNSNINSFSNIISNEFANYIFEDCVFSDFLINNICNKQNITFNYCFFEKVTISDLVVKKLIFYNSFSKNFSFSVIENVDIEKLHLNFTLINPNNSFIRFNQIIENIYNQRSKYCSDIHVDSNLLNVSELLIGNFTTKNQQMNNFEIKINIRQDYKSNNIKNIYIVNIQNALKIIISGKFENLIIDNIETLYFKFINFKYSIASINNIKPIGKNSRFIIENAEFEKCSFWNIDLESFDIVKMINSRINSSVFSLVSVPKNIITGYYNNEKSYIYEYEYYRQLSVIYNKNNDIENSLICKARQLKSLKNFNKKKNYFESKVILFLSEKSNEFGTNWKNSLYFIFIIPLFMFIFYLLSIDLLYIDIYSVNYDWKVIFSYFDFINPTHSKDFLIEKDSLKNYPCSILIDFISRIIVGFGIYQFITAFRRYGK